MMVQSTIDKINDTTIMRMLRKLCGFFDELVGRVTDDESKIQENTDMINDNKAAIDALSDKVQSLRDGAIIMTKDIAAIQETDKEQDTKINKCYNDVSISGNNLTLNTVGGSSKTVVLPTSGGSSIEITDINVNSATAANASAYLLNKFSEGSYHGCVAFKFADSTTIASGIFNEITVSGTTISLNGHATRYNLSDNTANEIYLLRIAPDAATYNYYDAELGYVGVNVTSVTVNGFAIKQ